MSLAAASPNPFQNTNGNSELKVGQALHLPKITHRQDNTNNNQQNQTNYRSLSRTGSWGSNNNMNDRYRYSDSSLSFNK
jgi:hypothetical protein